MRAFNLFKMGVKEIKYEMKEEKKIG